MEKKIKEPVRLRMKRLSNDNISLYLDIYHQGKRQYEFLKLYLVPENNKQDKIRNKETMMLANSIKAKRTMELQSRKFGFEADFKEKTLFYDYFKKIAAEITKRNKIYGTMWLSSLKFIELYASNPKLTFSDITPEWVAGYKSYLENDAVSRKCTKMPPHHLSVNTITLYYRIFLIFLNIALRNRVIKTNPAIGIKAFNGQEGTRMYLTVEEIRKLSNTHCSHPEIKRAFLFSCLTGIRKGDISRLTWNDVQTQGQFTRIIFRQEKTDNVEYLDINSQASAFLGERGLSDEKIFKGSTNSTTISKALTSWVKEAGIKKKITFHCARHTFAVMMLDLGTDIYTVSKLLGHKELTTTQIYAKVLDKNKQQAVNKIPPILGIL